MAFRIVGPNGPIGGKYLTMQQARQAAQDHADRHRVAVEIWDAKQYDNKKKKRDDCIKACERQTKKKPVTRRQSYARNPVRERRGSPELGEYYFNVPGSYSIMVSKSVKELAQIAKKYADQTGQRIRIMLEDYGTTPKSATNVKPSRRRNGAR